VGDFKMDLIEKKLTYKIRGAVFEVYRQLGSGYLEKVYERALLIELNDLGITAESQSPIAVNYKGHVVGDFFSDILVENRIILEIKAQQGVKPEHKAQILNYLKATGLRIGLLINFTHPKATIERFIN
jgi:GxxExxY protein